MAVRRVILWILLVVVATGAGWATTRIVDNTVTCDDTACAPCCTIQAAIGKSAGGDIVSVADGTYPETLDFRGMASIGDITVKAASTPGSVLVSSNGNDPAIHHQDQSPTLHMHTVTIEGITLSSFSDEPCLWIGHAGETVLRDVTANNCDYTALLFKDDGSDGVTGDVTMERVTANNAAVKEGIRIEGGSSATSVTLTDCTTNSNPGAGVTVSNVAGAVQITNPTAENNGTQGIDLEISGPLTISGANITDNGREGIYALSTSTIEISSSVVTGSKNGHEGVQLAGVDAVDTIDSVTLTGLQSNDNEDNGVSLAFVGGPVTVTNCSFENNGSDGLDIWDSALGELMAMGGLVITGGHATGNDDRGYQVRATGDAAVDGAQADNNDDRGFFFELTGVVSFENCSASGNGLGDGIRVESFVSNNLDEVTITDCTANDNGLLDGGNGIYVKEVTGPVTIDGTTTNGNNRTNVRVDATAGEVMISDCTANSGLEEGIKIDADVGPVTIQNCTADGNTLEGFKIQKENVDLETITVTKNMVTNNGLTGVRLSNLAAMGTFDATCNDIVGNDSGMYHDSAVTVDARYVWWGDSSGPSGKGSGSGDTVWYEPGGSILFTPWFTEPCASCVGVVNLTLENDSCDSPETFEACYSITAGPNYGVYGPNGELTLTAPVVLLEDGFFIGVDGSLTAGNL